MLKTVAVLVLSSILACVASVLKETCSTPGIKEGLCIKLEECSSINTMSNDFDTPMTVEKLNYLIDARCGYVEKIQKVCCPVEEVMSTMKMEETTNSVETTAISSDQNSQETTQFSTSVSQMREESTIYSQISEESTTSVQDSEDMRSTNEIM